MLPPGVLPKGKIMYLPESAGIRAKLDVLTNVKLVHTANPQMIEYSGFAL